MPAIPKPDTIIGHSAEWELLHDCHQRQAPDLVVVHGAQGAGKTFLLTRFAHAAEGLYYNASRHTEREQLSSLSQALGAHFNDYALQHSAGLASWDHLFAYIAQQARQGESPQPFLLVLDDFHHLLESCSELPQALAQAWYAATSGIQMTVILAGPHVPMRDVGAEGQLHTLITERVSIEPAVATMVPQFAASFSDEDQIRTFGLLGHSPSRLSLLDDESPFAVNMQRLLLDSQSSLAEAALHVLDAFVAKPAVHYSILDAIAAGDGTWNDIAYRVGRTGGGLLRPLQLLENMGLIERLVPITEASESRSRRARYRLLDPYLQAWHTLVAPLIRNGRLGRIAPADLWIEDVAPRVEAHTARIFEAICETFVREGGLSDDGFTAERVGGWWETNGANEIDIVAFGREGRVLIGECKWGKLTGQHLETLRERGERLEAELGGSVTDMVLFNQSGKRDRVVEAAVQEGVVRVITAADVLGHEA